jgi:hypothetical protein
LLDTVSVPVRVPEAVGRKVTDTEHVPPAAIVPQVFVCVKSPLVVTPDTVADAEPVLVIVTFCAELLALTAVLANVSDVGLAARVAVPAVAPVPDSDTVSAGLVALLLTVSVPVRAPEAVGVKVTLTVQLAPAAIDVPQVLVCAKSPLVVTEDTDAAAFPEFDKVTDCAPLVVLTVWLAKVSEPGFALSVADVVVVPPDG